MKKSRFTETQIVAILKEAESGIAMADILRTHGIVAPPFIPKGISVGHCGDPNTAA